MHVVTCLLRGAGPDAFAILDTHVRPLLRLVRYIEDVDSDEVTRSVPPMTLKAPHARQVSRLGGASATRWHRQSTVCERIFILSHYSSYSYAGGCLAWAINITDKQALKPILTKLTTPCRKSKDRGAAGLGEDREVGVALGHRVDGPHHLLHAFVAGKAVR